MGMRISLENGFLVLEAISARNRMSIAYFGFNSSQLQLGG